MDNKTIEKSLKIDSLFLENIVTGIVKEINAKNVVVALGESEGIIEWDYIKTWKKGKISVVVDGDLRRHSNNLYKKKIEQIATKNPSWISENATALSAISLMTKLRISSLLVAKDNDINIQ